MKQAPSSTPFLHAAAWRNVKPGGTYIGVPRRIYTVEPLEDPIPGEQPPPSKEEPSEPAPERVRVPEEVPVK